VWLGMAKRGRSGRGRGKGRGQSKEVIGASLVPVISETIPPIDSEVFDDAKISSDLDVALEGDLESVHSSISGVIQDEVADLTDDNGSMDSGLGHQEFDVDCLSLGSFEEPQAVDDKEIAGPTIVDPNQESNEWRNLFKTERVGNLQYYAPQKAGGKTSVFLPAEAVEEGINKWKFSLVGQFLDKSLPFFLVKKTIDVLWKDYGKVEVLSLENGLFIFRFADGNSCDEVLESKLWHIANKPLILRKWSPGMQVLKLTLTSIPVWIKHPHLPLECWSPFSLSLIANGVGKPLYADKVTEEQRRLGFARVLVEIDVNSDCPREIEINMPDGSLVQVGVEYPWLPPKCSICKGFGHAAFACSKKEKK
jgi:hypothetical protein